MVDASAYDMEENIARTKRQWSCVMYRDWQWRASLGHVGQAATLDGCDVSLYTKPEEAVRFVQETGVDSLAIACGTAHGDYPKGFIPTINFDVIRGVKQAVNMPLALHGGSGSGDENIRKAGSRNQQGEHCHRDIQCMPGLRKNRLDENRTWIICPL